MRRKSYNDPGHVHFLTFSCYKKLQILTDDLIRQWLCAAISDAREVERFDLWAFVIMPDHVHLLLRPREESYSIPAILRRIKEPLAHRVVRLWQESAPYKLDRVRAKFGSRYVHRIWQPGGGFDKNLTETDAIAKAIEYIEYNPVRRGLVAEPTEWKWSSAQARTGCVDIPLKIDPVDVFIEIERGATDRP